MYTKLILFKEATWKLRTYNYAGIYITVAEQARAVFQEWVTSGRSGARGPNSGTRSPAPSRPQQYHPQQRPPKQPQGGTGQAHQLNWQGWVLSCLDQINNFLGTVTNVNAFKTVFIMLRFENIKLSFKPIVYRKLGGTNYQTQPKYIFFIVLLLLC